MIYVDLRPVPFRAVLPSCRAVQCTRSTIYMIYVDLRPVPSRAVVSCGAVHPFDDLNGLLQRHFSNSEAAQGLRSHPLDDLNALC